MNEKLLRNIENAINHSGIKWQKIAQELNITYPYLWRIIKGQRRLKPEMILQIAKLTGTTPNELYGLEDLKEKSGS